MWWKSKPAGEGDGTVAELRAQIRDIEGRLKGLETEWAAVYQKVLRAVGHITKVDSLNRVRAAANGEQPEAPQTTQRNLEDLSRDEIARL